MVKALNEAPSDALQGEAPDAIDDVKEFDLQKLNAEKAAVSEKKQVDHKAKIAATGTVRPLIAVKPHRKGENEDDMDEETRPGLGPRRRKFLATYSGKTEQAQRDEEGKVMFFSGKKKTHTEA